MAHVRDLGAEMVQSINGTDFIKYVIQKSGCVILFLFPSLFKKSKRGNN